MRATVIQTATGYAVSLRNGGTHMSCSEDHARTYAAAVNRLDTARRVIGPRVRALVVGWYGNDTLPRIAEERRLSGASLRGAYAVLARRIRAGRSAR